MTLWKRFFEASKQRPSAAELDYDPYAAPDAATFVRRDLPADESELPTFKLLREEAERRGQSVEDLLEESYRGALESTYPTPECLSVDELVAVVNGERLKEERLAHVLQCDACAGAAVGAGDSRGKIVDQVMEQVQQELLSPHPPKKSSPRPTKSASWEEPEIEIFDPQSLRNSEGPLEPPPYRKSHTGKP